MYSYTTSADARAVDHAEHNRESWHAYVNDLSGAPSWVDATATGVCCHDCQLVIVESF